ncbi:MAG: hypothetical protein ACPG4N_13625, partial [Gammaproteobacteria bacterium]
LWDSMDACDCLDEVGSRHVFQGKTEAVHAIFQRLDKSICARCDARIFRECHAIPKAPSNLNS